MPRFSGTLVEEAAEGPWVKYQRQQQNAVPVDGPWVKYQRQGGRFGGRPVEDADTAASGGAASLPADLSWSDVPGQAAKNFGASAGQFAGDIANTLTDPVGTFNAMGNLAESAGAKFGLNDKGDPGAADMLGQFFMERYGGMENLKRTMASDPVGFLGDVSTVLSAGGSLGARAPGMMGQVARAARTAGNAVDPLTVAANTAGKTLKGAGSAASHLFGNKGATGVGAGVIQEMASAGRAGNTAALDQLRDRAPVSDISDSANRAVGEMHADRSAKFDADMTPARADGTPLSFVNVHKALREAADETFHRGEAKDTRAASALKDMRSIVGRWQNKNLNTVMDFDALKQRLGEIREGTEAGTLARRITDKVYGAVRKTAGPQGSAYDIAQKGYKADTDALTEIRKEFSLNEKTTTNTQARKLVSSMRNNVSTNFGERERLMRELAKKEPALPGMVAGREMSAASPRGIGGVLSNPLIGSPLTLSAYAMHPWALAAIPPALLAASPRAVGEAAYGVGRAARAIDNAPLTPAQRRLISHTAYQSGRAKRESKK